MSSSSPAASGSTLSLNNDIFLRPPLLLRLPNDGHDEAVRPIICRLLVASSTLRLRVETCFSAVVLWHRYIVAVSSANDQQTTAPPTDLTWEAAACLFLACKAEEEPRRMRDVINISRMFLQDQQQSIPLSNEQNQVAASTPESAIIPDGNGAKPPGKSLILHAGQYPPPLDDHYWESKPVIVRAEQKVLRWLGFDVSVSKPHRVVQFLLREPKIEEGLLRRRSVTHDQIAPIAWRRLNDALFFANALRHSVMALAAASVDLAVEEITTSSKDSSCPWWLFLKVPSVAIVSARKDLVAATEFSALGHPADMSATTKN